MKRAYFFSVCEQFLDVVICWWISVLLH